MACLYLCRLRVQEGELVLVHGASGAVGTAAVQIAKSIGKTFSKELSLCFVLHWICLKPTLDSFVKLISSLT